MNVLRERDLYQEIGWRPFVIKSRRLGGLPALLVSIWDGFLEIQLAIRTHRVTSNVVRHHG